MDTALSKRRRQLKEGRPRKPGPAIANTGALEKLKEVVLRFLKDEDVKVVLFGSRAREDFASASDVDIGIIAGDNFDKRKITLLREYLEESTIPYKVDIVDFSMVSEEFKQSVLKDAKVWKD